jgi:hypothetical protein
MSRTRSKAWRLAVVSAPRLAPHSRDGVFVARAMKDQRYGRGAPAHRYSTLDDRAPLLAPHRD